MKVKNSYKIEDLIEQIEKVNKMVELHQGDDFMQGQYVYRRNVFLKQLIAELLKLDGYSPRLFDAIRNSVKLLEKDAAKFAKPLPEDWQVDLRPLAA